MTWQVMTADNDGDGVGRRSRWWWTAARADCEVTDRSVYLLSSAYAYCPVHSHTRQAAGEDIISPDFGGSVAAVTTGASDRTPKAGVG